MRVPEESSSEVTSSSAGLVMSPANSLVSSDIGDVDLEFWDLDVNGQHQARLGIIQNGFNAVQGHTVLTNNHHPTPKSEAGSLSGTRQLAESPTNLLLCKNVLPACCRTRLLYSNKCKRDESQFCFRLIRLPGKLARLNRCCCSF